jgi:NADH-quinone oxidoreductase subunit N
VERGLAEKLEWIKQSLASGGPEIILSAGLLMMVLLGLIVRDPRRIFALASWGALIIFLFTFVNLSASLPATPSVLWSGMIKQDDVSVYFKLLFNTAALLTTIMTWRNKNQKHPSEFYAVLIAIVLGAHLLVTSANFIMIFVSLETISIGSYILTGFLFSRNSAEGSLKYFLFGSTASAIMLYGFSILYGLTGTMNLFSPDFMHQLMDKSSPLVLTATLLVAAGFLYKIAAAPMHPWSPDVYEAAPMPVVAFFSVVPKLAGLGAFINFVTLIKPVGQSYYDWQVIISVIAILTLTVGNFSALLQKNAKRLMAYSSIAQSGFLLIAVAAFLPTGIHVLLFYATVYMLANYVIFLFLQYYESHNIHTIAGFAGMGKKMAWSFILITIALLTLTGLPPTSGFAAKVFIFSSLWDAYSLTGKPMLLVLFIFGLLNTVVSLFYYLQIPYYAFLKDGKSDTEQNNAVFENLLGLILVVVILILFFVPGLLMGWINKINFVL